MKKLICLILFLLPVVVFGQTTGSINIFSENGDKFYLFLDGVKQNDTARSNLRIQGLPDLYYSAKIIFLDNAISPVLKNNLYVSDADDIMRDAVYRLRREKGGKPKLTFYSMLTAQKNFEPPAGMYVYHFGKPSLSETMPVAEKKDSAVYTPTTKEEGSLTVFSQNGDKFYLFLNGVKQNNIAQSNIRIQQLSDLYYNLKIIFADTKKPPILKYNLSISDGEDSLMDATYRIRRDKNGYPKLNFYSIKNIQENFAPSSGMYVYNFGKPSAPVASAAPKKNIQTNSKLINTAAEAKKATVKTAANTKTGFDANEKNKPADIKPEASKKIPENKKCNGWPMTASDLANVKKTINKLGRDEEKLSTAQEIIASNCLLTTQVSEICVLFKSEKSKLAFAKYAYKFTIDRKNYISVNKTFSLETSKKELNKFINGG